MDTKKAIRKRDKKSLKQNAALLKPDTIQGTPAEVASHEEKAIVSDEDSEQVEMDLSGDKEGHPVEETKEGVDLEEAKDSKSEPTFLTRPF